MLGSLFSERRRLAYERLVANEGPPTRSPTGELPNAELKGQQREATARWETFNDRWPSAERGS